MLLDAPGSAEFHKKQRVRAAQRVLSRRTGTGRTYPSPQFVFGCTVHAHMQIAAPSPTPQQQPLPRENKKKRGRGDQERGKRRKERANIKGDREKTPEGGEKQCGGRPRPWKGRAGPPGAAPRRPIRGTAGRGLPVAAAGPASGPGAEPEGIAARSRRRLPSGPTAAAGRGGRRGARIAGSCRGGFPLVPAPPGTGCTEREEKRERVGGGGKLFLLLFWFFLFVCFLTVLGVFVFRRGATLSLCPAWRERGSEDGLRRSGGSERR